MSIVVDRHGNTMSHIPLTQYLNTTSEIVRLYKFKLFSGRMASFNVAQSAVLSNKGVCMTDVFIAL